MNFRTQYVCVCIYVYSTIINQLNPQPHELIGGLMPCTTAVATLAIYMLCAHPTHLNGILCIFQVTSRPYSRVDIAELILQAT